MDEEQRTIFSFSGYKGEKDVLGAVWGNSFHVQKRRYWRNDFALNFYGELQPEASGTRIEGRFDLADWVRLFMWFWLGGVVLIGGAIFVATLSEIIAGSQLETGDAAVSLIVPPAMLLFGIVLPRLGRLLGRSDETFILDHLQNTLSARIDVPV